MIYHIFMECIMVGYDCYWSVQVDIYIFSNQLSNAPPEPQSFTPSALIYTISNPQAAVNQCLYSLSL